MRLFSQRKRKNTKSVRGQKNSGSDGFFAACVMLLWAFSNAAVFAQGIPNVGQLAPQITPDYNQLAPKTLPNSPAPQPTPEGDLPEATGDPTLLTNKLAGLIFVTSPEKIKTEGLQELSELLKVKGGYTIAPDLQPPDVAGFEKIVQTALGKPASMLSLNQMLRDLVAHYRANGRPIVDVYIPEQAMVNSVVQVVVSEGHFGTVKVEGNKFFKTSLFTSAIRARPGDPIYADHMANDATWLNNNPFRQVEMAYTKSEEEGKTDVTLKVSDKFPLRGYIGFDDSGNKLTGDDRYSIGYNWGNVFNLDHQFNYQFITSQDVNLIKAHSASYTAPLPWRHTLTAFGSYGDTVADFGADSTLASKGYSWQTSLRYDIPIIGFKSYKHDFTFGYDFKQSNSDLFQGGIVANRSLTDVSQFMLGYNGNEDDKAGFTSFSASWFLSPGSMTTNNNDAAFQGANADRASYTYANFTLSRLTKLPWEFTWAFHGMYQWSNARLLGSEQLGLGGYSTVRGYDEHEASGDSGYLISNELRTPPVSIGKWFGLEKANDQLQFLIFHDYGGTSLYDPDKASGPEGPNITLMSVGPGLRYNIGSNLSMRFDYGWQMSDTDVSLLTRRDNNSRAHFSIVVSY